MTILALTTGLAGVLGLLVGFLANGLAVSNLGSANVGLDLELTEQTVNDDLQMELAHAGDDRLAGLLIGPGAEGRVFFSELCQRNAHLLRAGLGLGLDGNADNGLREVHGLQNDGVLLVAQRVTGGGILQTDSSRNIARVNGVDVLTVVGVHLQDTADTLIVILDRVVDGGACVQRTGVHTEEAELTDIRVSHDLEGQSCERLVVGGDTILLLAGLGVGALDGCNVGRSRHVVNNGIQQLLNAAVLVGGAADNGNDLVRDGSLTQSRLDFFLGQLFAFQVLHHQLFVGLSNSFDQLVMVLLSLLLHILGDRLNADVIAHVIIVDVSLHIDQVDNTLEGILLTDGQLDGHTVGVQTIMEHLNAAVEIGTHGVHLVDVHHAGNLVLVSLTPNGLRLRLNTALSGQNGNGTVQNTQRTLNLNSEVNVTRGVDDVDTMAVLLEESRIVLGLGMAPIAGGSSGSDGDTTLLLLFHPVHRSSAVMNLTDLMVDTGVVQDALGGGGLTCVDVGHDTDVTGHLQRYISRRSHGLYLLDSESITIVGKSLVGLGHLVRILALLDRAADTVGGVDDLSSQTSRHGLLATGAAVSGQPAQAEGLAAGRANFQRNLIVSAADTAGLALEVRHDVLHCLLEHLERVVAGLFLHDVECIVNDLLRNTFLAIQHDVVDQAGDNLGIVNRIGQNFAFRDITSSGHLSSLLHINDIIGTRKLRNSRCATKKALAYFMAKRCFLTSWHRPWGA